MAEDHSAERIEILPVHGIGELRPGDDLAETIVKHASLQDGDVLVVTSKAVSKVEGRLISLGSTDPAERDIVRQEAIRAETARLVAQRGPLRIVQTRQRRPRRDRADARRSGPLSCRIARRGA